MPRSDAAYAVAAVGGVHSRCTKHLRYPVGTASPHEMGEIIKRGHNGVSPLNRVFLLPFLSARAERNGAPAGKQARSCNKAQTVRRGHGVRQKETASGKAVPPEGDLPGEKTKRNFPHFPLTNTKKQVILTVLIRLIQLSIQRGEIFVLDQLQRFQTDL